MASIFNNLWGNTPSKAASNGQVPGSSGSRGTKRKAKPDPYDDMDEDDAPMPAPSRRASSRISEASTSVDKARLSVGKIKRRSRSSLPSRVSDAPQASPQASRIDAASSRARAKAPEPAQLQADPDEEKNRNSLVPVADMGGEDLLGSNDAPDAVADAAPRPKAGMANKSTANNTHKGKGKATQLEPEEAEEAEEDDREEHEIASLVKHRMSADGSGAVDILVHWAGEKAEDATWESEEEIQKSAEEALYAYWRAQGGRLNALFIKPKNPPTETYHVFRILGHEKKSRGGFQFEVQWVGHPATRGETSMETETKLKNVAPELLNEYWEIVGGRASHLAKRGRAKKARTE
ncbi:Uu.00g120700.m01.CDS01 [Anthostomella pinea]|uniref:Uu.00g120700.m01.CDS01 n=1 Tax=Anthostomella pinea TaxID=933095 RepID=A0AAI8VHJ4_9PEZI|nr:Uu.00g120700.m01.CDS01 [Anthostomella pinea]